MLQFFIFIYFPQTHGPYHKGNGITQEQKSG